MTLTKKLKTKLKSLAQIGVLATAALLPQTANAQEETRDFHIDLAHPTMNFDARSNLKYSLDQVTGKLSDLAGKKALDNSLTGRIAQLAVLGYSGAFTNFTTHELAHEEIGEKGGDYKNLTFQNALTFHSNPQMNHKLSSNQRIRLSAAGPNQEEYSAFLIADRNNESMTFDQGYNFLFTKWNNFLYNLFMGNEKIRGNSSDFTEYAENLRDIGIHTSRDRILFHSFLSSALSPHSFFAGQSLYNYLVNGERSTEIPKIEIENLEFSYPLLSHYLGTRGALLDISSRVKWADNRIDFSIGTDLDFLGGGKEDRLRFSASSPIEIDEHFTITPYAALNIQPSNGNYKGILLGVGGHCKIGELLNWRGVANTMGISLNAQIAHNDLIEQGVKDYEDAHAQLGIDFRW